MKMRINYIGYGIIAFFLLIFLFKWFLESRENRLLENYVVTKAVVLEIHKPETIHGSYSGLFKYRIRNKTYQFKEIGDFTMLRIGDTIEIKYAFEDYSVAKVFDKYDMKKYRHLKN